MIVDVHCHYFAYGGGYGCYVNPRLKNSYRVRLYLASSGVLSWSEALAGTHGKEDKIDEHYRTLLIKSVNESELDHAVILAFDGVYTSFGHFSYMMTPKYTSNDSVVDLCKESPKLLFGASVNPMRRDALDELDKCAEQGAVLVKWLPSVMGFDPSDKKYRPFYDRCQLLKLPLLIHIGFEYAVPNIDIRYVGLDRLESALESGVTVIAAHCCGGRPFIDDMVDFAKMRMLVERFPNLYLDVSALGSAHRKARFMSSLRDPVVRERLVFGTDFPIPNHPWAFKKELALYEKTPATLPSNYFDRDILIKRACRLPEAAMSRGYKPLRKVSKMLAVAS